MTVDIFPLKTPMIARGKRGPKTTELPEDIIFRWADEGLGSKAIATRLRAEEIANVSYKTVQRRLQEGKHESCS